MISIKVKKLTDSAKLPTRGTTGAAGWDLYALEDELIKPGESKMINTGIAIEIPEDCFGAIYARSGLACKHGLRPANCVGIIDSDYRGEIIVCLRNDYESSSVEFVPYGGSAGTYQTKPNWNNEYSIKAGERIAQLIIQKYEKVELIEVKQLSDTERGNGGFGSSGKD